METRSSLTEAAALVVAKNPGRSIHDAAQKLLDFVRRDRIRLRCNGNLVTPNFATTSMTMVVVIDADGQARVDAIPAGGIGWDGDSHTFELDIDELRQVLEPLSDDSVTRTEAGLRRLYPPDGDPKRHRVIEKEAMRQ